jgi:hypothetical protein
MILLLATVLLYLSKFSALGDTVHLSSLPLQINVTSAIQSATVLPIPQIGVNLPTASSELEQKITFTSISLRDEIVGLTIPPDPFGAAGPSSVISVVNVAIQAMDRSGAVLWVASLNDFFL